MINPETSKPKIETPKKEATDAELSAFLIEHIMNPCSDASGENIRYFYIEEAKRALKTMTDPEAKHLLQELITACSK